MQGFPTSPGRICGTPSRTARKSPVNDQDREGRIHGQPMSPPLFLHWLPGPRQNRLHYLAPHQSHSLLFRKAVSTALTSGGTHEGNGRFTTRCRPEAVWSSWIAANDFLLSFSANRTNAGQSGSRVGNTDSPPAGSLRSTSSPIGRDCAFPWSSLILVNPSICAASFGITFTTRSSAGGWSSSSWLGVVAADRAHTAYTSPSSNGL